MIKKVLGLIFLTIVILFVYVSFQTSDYFIKREIVINSKADNIYPYLVSMKKADDWMPWKEEDPQVKNIYLGPEEGIGAISSWESTGKMGVGKAEVVDVQLNQKVKTKITYLKPMEFVQDSEFKLTPKGESTTMEWSVSGKSSFIARLLCTLRIMDMDKYVGGEFEKGLIKLKSLVESNIK